jgi:hypothetical protein
MTPAGGLTRAGRYWESAGRPNAICLGPGPPKVELGHPAGAVKSFAFHLTPIMFIKLFGARSGFGTAPADTPRLKLTRPPSVGLRDLSLACVVFLVKILLGGDSPRFAV